jgi:hypothetical protein
MTEVNWEQKAIDMDLKLPLSVKDTAKLWNMSVTWVKVLIGQGRVKHQKVGGGKVRAGALLVMQFEPPPNAKETGGLSEKQKAIKDKAAGRKPRKRIARAGRSA